MAGSPLFMQDVTLTLVISGGPTPVEYNCDIHTAEILSKAGDTIEYTTLCPDGSYSRSGKTTYSLHIVAVQRWAADGLAAFLWDNDGALADFQYQAHGDGVTPTADLPGMTGTVQLVAPSYGGEAATWAELDVELPCQTKPVKVSAAFPAADAELAADESASKRKTAAA
jgi:hypothetical protein